MARWRSGNAGVCKTSMRGSDSLPRLMYYVYALKSLHNGDLYIGFTTDLKQRFIQHNNRKVLSTRSNTPWKLVYYEAYSDKNDATRREKQLKMHRAKSDLVIQISESLE